jgi:hypothetical protein
MREREPCQKRLGAGSGRRSFRHSNNGCLAKLTATRRASSIESLPAQPIDATLYLRWKDGVYSVIYEESGLSVSSQAHLNKVMGQLNERPRKALGIETPAERFNASVAPTS